MVGQTGITESVSLTSTELDARNAPYLTKAPKTLDNSISKSESSMHPATFLPNSEKTESLTGKTDEITLSTPSEAILKLKRNDLENSTEPPVTPGSVTSFFSANKGNKLKDISTTYSASFWIERDMIDNSIRSESDDKLELQLSISEKDGKNESQISVINSTYMNEVISFCLSIIMH